MAYLPLVGLLLVTVNVALLTRLAEAASPLSTGGGGGMAGVTTESFVQQHPALSVSGRRRSRRSKVVAKGLELMVNTAPESHSHLHTNNKSSSTSSSSTTTTTTSSSTSSSSSISTTTTATPLCDRIERGGR